MVTNYRIAHFVKPPALQQVLETHFKAKLDGKKHKTIPLNFNSSLTEFGGCLLLGKLAYSELKPDREVFTRILPDGAPVLRKEKLTGAELVSSAFGIAKVSDEKKADAKAVLIQLAEKYLGKKIVNPENFNPRSDLPHCTFAYTDRGIVVNPQVKEAKLIVSRNVPMSAVKPYLPPKSG